MYDLRMGRAGNIAFLAIGLVLTVLVTVLLGLVYADRKSTDSLVALIAHCVCVLLVSIDAMYTEGRNAFVSAAVVGSGTIAIFFNTLGATSGSELPRWALGTQLVSVSLMMGHLFARFQNARGRGGSIVAV